MSEENLNEDKAGMAALESISETVETAAPAEPKIDELGRSYATGRRKNASARVWIKRGTGRVTVNGKDINTYFARPVLQMLLAQPFQTVEREGEFDVMATVVGGGLSGQAGAVARRQGVLCGVGEMGTRERSPLKPKHHR